MQRRIDSEVLLNLEAGQRLCGQRLRNECAVVLCNYGEDQ